MCGITGIASRNVVDFATVARMRDLLAHRGPDHAGIWATSDQRTVLGHRRLTVIDPSPAANQPFLSADGVSALVFNGEIYNHRALAADLRRAGVTSRTTSDTEVVLHMMLREGPTALRRFSGMFALALWDGARRRLICARDRAGEKPLHYALTSDAFVFGSEIRAVLAAPGVGRSIDPRGVADFLTIGFVPDPRTAWHGIAKLPPGHWLLVELPPGEPPRVDGPHPWWSFEPEPTEVGDDVGEEIRDVVARAADEMTVADVPVGCFLSGGVDSSAVVAALATRGRAPRTFTVGFSEASHDERPHAALVARLYGTDHQVHEIRPHDALVDIDRLVAHLDEPFNDYSYLPMWHLCRETRRHVTVALSGDGGDEAFAGYAKSRRLGLRGAVTERLPSCATRLVGAFADRMLSPFSRLRRTLIQHGRPLVPALADMFVVGIPHSLLLRYARGPLRRAVAEHHPEDVVRPHLQGIDPGRTGWVNAMRRLDFALTLPGDILVKVDRMSMAVSLEVRAVFLHRDVLDLARRLPEALLADRYEAKKALRAALRPWLPPSILDRRKQGFALPLGQWLARGLADSLSSRDPKPLDEWLDPALLQRLLAAHRSGIADQSGAIHACLFLDRWLRHWTTPGLHA